MSTYEEYEKFSAKYDKQRNYSFYDKHPGLLALFILVGVLAFVFPTAFFLEYKVVYPNEQRHNAMLLANRDPSVGQVFFKNGDSKYCDGGTLVYRSASGYLSPVPNSPSCIKN